MMAGVTTGSIMGCYMQCHNSSSICAAATYSLARDTSSSAPGIVCDTKNVRATIINSRVICMVFGEVLIVYDTGLCVR